MARRKKTPMDERVKPKFCRVCKEIKDADLFLTKGNKAMLSVCDLCRKDGYVKIQPETRLCAYLKCKDPITSNNPRKRYCNAKCYDNDQYYKKHHAVKDETKGTVDPKWLVRGEISSHSRGDSMSGY